MLPWCALVGGEQRAVPVAPDLGADLMDSDCYALDLYVNDGDLHTGCRAIMSTLRYARH